MFNISFKACLRSNLRLVNVVGLSLASSKKTFYLYIYKTILSIYFSQITNIFFEYALYVTKRHRIANNIANYKQQTKD